MATSVTGYLPKCSGQNAQVADERAAANVTHIQFKLAGQDFIAVGPLWIRRAGEQLALPTELNRGLVRNPRGCPVRRKSL